MDRKRDSGWNDNRARILMKCVDEDYYPPAKGCNRNRLHLPSPHREIPFEQRSRSLSESTEASDVPLCIPFAEVKVVFL